MRRTGITDRRLSMLLWWSVACLFAIGGAGLLWAHGSEARFVERIPWEKARFTRTLGLGRALGLRVRNAIEMKTIDDKSCVLGTLIAFDVDDDYAFDIDEPVELTLTYAPEHTRAFRVSWDQNGGEGRGFAEVEPEPGTELRRVSVTLEHARLAGRGTLSTDIAVGGRDGLGLCDIEIVRSGSTKPAGELCALQLEIRDGSTGKKVPARVGLYDATGRSPLPSDQALTVHRFADEVRMVRVRERSFWPTEHRQAFYVDGSYETSLPAGSYELVVARGPEYRLHHDTIEIREGAPSNVTVSLKRYADLPGQGWLSGDGHIHVPRDEVEDYRLWAQMAAEDVHVASLLQMGNISGTHFDQPGWGEEERFEREGHVLVSGQEDPRTGQRGHTIHHNLDRPIHDQDSYYLYHRVFEESHRQGGVSGYAHLGEWFGAQRGLALDVPFGLVDFIEVLQSGRLLTETWYGFLNLGYKVNPAAGSDFPYIDLPGTVRNYAKVDGAFSPDAWFAAFRAGHMYVTNGPFLELTVNGQGMGEELRVERGARLDIVAEARLNPDVDELDRLELIVHGDIVATETAGDQERVELRTELTAEHSMWIAVRAFGARQEERNLTVAHSAPIYVVAGGEPFWKAEALSELVAKQRAKLEELISSPVEPNEDLETWETRTDLLEQWAKQLPQVKQRVEEADALYRKLLERAQQSSQP